MASNIISGHRQEGGSCLTHSPELYKHLKRLLRILATSKNLIERDALAGRQGTSFMLQPGFSRANDLQRLEVHTPELLGFHHGQLVDDPLSHLDRELHERGDLATG